MKITAAQLSPTKSSHGPCAGEQLQPWIGGPGRGDGSRQHQPCYFTCAALADMRGHFRNYIKLLCVCICLFVCVHVHRHVCAVCMYCLNSMRVHMCRYVLCLCVHMCVCMHLCICQCVCGCVYMYVHMCVYMCGNIKREAVESMSEL